jgi:hypothetical protein
LRKAKDRDGRGAGPAAQADDAARTLNQVAASDPERSRPLMPTRRSVAAGDVYGRRTGERRSPRTATPRARLWPSRASTEPNGRPITEAVVARSRRRSRRRARTSSSPTPVRAGRMAAERRATRTPA